MNQKYSQKCDIPPNQTPPALTSLHIETPLGLMLAISDEKALYLLEFNDKNNIENEIKKIQINLTASITQGKTEPLNSITSELKDYFDGSLKTFKTPFYMIGTPFQQQVWNQLLSIPYGKTRSYEEQAIGIGKQTAYRAVANANGANQLAILIPCHRIINKNGNLGGYAGGIERKKWLLNHEKLRD